MTACPPGPGCRANRPTWIPTYAPPGEPAASVLPPHIPWFPPQEQFAIRQNRICRGEGGVHYSMASGIQYAPLMVQGQVQVHSEYIGEQQDSTTSHSIFPAPSATRSAHLTIPLPQVLLKDFKLIGLFLQHCCCRQPSRHSSCPLQCVWVLVCHGHRREVTRVGARVYNTFP